MDIGILTEDYKFKFRVCGVIVKNGKVLLEKGNSGGYGFPGGHVAFGESSRETVIREVKEELGIRVEIDSLLCVCENLFELGGKLNQEVNYYYYVKPIDDLPNKAFSLTEIDNGVEKTHNYEWVDVFNVLDCGVRPFDVSKLLVKNAKNEIIIIDERK